MKTVAIAHLMFFCATVAQAFAQAPPPLLPPPAPIRVSGDVAQTGGGVIEGVVKNLNSNDPLAQTPVILTGPPDATAAVPQLRTTTDDQGRFTFRNLPPGRYTVVAQRDGYFRRLLQGGAANTVVIGSGNNIVSLILSLIQGGTISGRILDPTGRPAAAVSVTAVRRYYQDGRPSLASVKSTTSDDRGEYRLYWLEPGEYFVLAEKNLVTGPARAYFPGGSDGRAALHVIVAEGEESSRTDFSLESAPSAVNVSGVVTIAVAGLESSSPAPSVSPAGTREIRAVADGQTSSTNSAPQFYLVPSDGGRAYDGLSVFPNALASDQDRAAGRFELRNVRPGSYELYAVLQDRRSSPAKYYMSHTSIDVGVQDVTGIALTIKPGIDLTGAVREGAGIPSTPVRIQLRPRVLLPNWISATVLSRDGTFAIPNVPESQFVVSVEPSEPDSYVAELLQGQNSIVDSGIVTVARGLPTTLEARIQSPASSIRGTVSASPQQLAAGVMITLVPEESRRENFVLYKRAIASANGEFSFVGVTPGRYKLFAWGRIPDGAEQNEEFMEAFRDSGTEIVTSAGNTTSAELRLTSK